MGALAPVLMVAALMPAVAVGAESERPREGAPALQPSRTAGAPNTLILALDGVAFRVVESAREHGAFSGWPQTRRLVSTFPSMTNVSFTAIFDAEPMEGYELRYFDRARNGIVYDEPGEWRRSFDAGRNGFGHKAGAYLRPKHEALRELRHVENFVLDRPSETMYGLISSTDMLLHFRGDEPVRQLLVTISRRLEELRRRHEELTGRPLQVVLLSDHGNAAGKVESPVAVRRILREAGLNPAKRLEAPDDVVPLTYGVCSFGSLYLEARNAEKVARVVTADPAVDVAAWVAGNGQLRVLAADGEARVRWRHDGPDRELAYEAVLGDPLLLSEALTRMADAGAFDAEGFASRDAWFEHTARSEFPDPLSRLVHALDGPYVRNRATVIFSLKPGHGWGVWKARAGAWIRPRVLKATHGGLDGESTWGFFLRSDGEADSQAAVRADQALAEWSGRGPREPVAGLHAEVQAP